jgi:hypothetical protein
MMTDTMALFAMFEALGTLTGSKREATVVPEPEFKPFKLSKRGSVAAPATALAAANTTREARTLEDLGVPAPLAAELELSLRALGMTKGDRVTRFTFRTTDGASYALKTTPERTRAAGDRAA